MVTAKESTGAFNMRDIVRSDSKTCYVDEVKEVAHREYCVVEINVANSRIRDLKDRYWENILKTWNQIFTVCRDRCENWNTKMEISEMIRVTKLNHQ